MAGSCFGGVLLCCNGHGEWGQAVEESWEGVGREVVKRRRQGEEGKRDGL